MGSAVHGVRGAIDPLLGYLSSAIREEAQLLGGARRDAQFIKDEMESMNGFLRHLAEAGMEQEHDHQVRAWMKQVRDLAYDTEECIHLYTLRVRAVPRERGAWGHVRRIPFYLRTILPRHRVAKQMRELKARARDIGERRNRYGVMVPAKAAGSGHDAIDDKETDTFRRALVDAVPATLVKDTAEELIRWLYHRRHQSDTGGRLVVLAVVAPDGVDGGELLRELYQHSSLGRLFDCKAFVTIQRPPFLGEVLHDMVASLELLPSREEGTVSTGTPEYLEASDEQQLLQERVKDKRLLAVVEDVQYPYPWSQLKEILDSSGCSPGSAIIVTTKENEVAKNCSPDETKMHSLVQLCYDKAGNLVFKEDDHEYDLKRKAIRCILEKCNPDLFCMKLLLRALYADPSTSRKQLEDLCTSLHTPGRPDAIAKKHIQRKMLKFGYDKLPKIYKMCLLYLSLFPPNWEIRRASLVRRWVAEGHVWEGDGEGALDRAERCFNELVAQGFVTIAKASNVGRVISCKVQDFVHDFIVEVVRDENFGDVGLPPNLARHLSISSGIQWQQDPSKKKKKQDGFGSICSCFCPAEQQGARDDIIPFLESLPAFSRVGRVKVMDLDYCKDLNNKHLKCICNNLFMLRYLSLRNTAVSQLPREINKLQKLETLDIRQTKMKASATKRLELPKLKHLLAGPTDYRMHTSINPKKQLSTVRMPRNIGRMTNMEILSYVEVAEDDAELEQVNNLKRLRDLGVVIHGKQSNVDNLLKVIKELSESLCSLSVWVRPPPPGANNEREKLLMNLPEIIASPLKSLQMLSINGITGGLPNWINELSSLAEITFRETLLWDTSLRVLGKLQSLRCLRLRHNSYKETNLTFKHSEFKALEILFIQGLDITRITFETDAAPKLTKIVWTFDKREITPDISGINNLPGLKEFVLSGDGDLRQVQQAVDAHPNLPDFRCVPIGTTST